MFNPNMTYIVCSFGGSGSYMMIEYLKNFGNVVQIHDRNPPMKLTIPGCEENKFWFSNIEIDESQLQNYKVIYIYRNPIYAIYSRFIHGPHQNIHKNHMNNIKAEHYHVCRILEYKTDLYKLGEFFDNYTIPNSNRNYPIYCVNYDKFWDNIDLFNKVMELPDIKEFYPERKETEHEHIYDLTDVYANLNAKMNNLDATCKM